MPGSICWENELAPLAQRHADRTAVTDLDGDVTFAELFGRAAGVAGRLVDAGVRPGEPVATFLRNGRSAVWAGYGAALAGAAETPLNTLLSRDEIAHCLRIAGIRRIVTDAAGAALVEGLASELHLVEDIGPAGLGGTGLPAVPADAWGKIVFTSGTTGAPKGVVYTHGGRWTANLLLRATLQIAPCPGDKVLLMTPYSHGSSLLCAAFLDGGAAAFLLNGVDTATVLPILEEGRADQIFAPPTVLAKILAAAGDRTFPHIRMVFTGTAPLAPELYAKARHAFGPVVRLTYGKSEIFNPITVLTPEETDAWYAEPDAGKSICVGWPASGVEVRIEPQREGEPMTGRPGAGRLLLRARHMLAGYLTGRGFAPLAPDEFHETGDIGMIDAKGRLHLCGREGDLIKTGGYRVSPDEIEGYLRPALPDGELLVVGLPSAYWGEVITVAAAGAPPGWERSLAPVLERMTPYKRPRLFVTLPELPRNTMGKIVRAKVRSIIAEDYVLEDGPKVSLTRRTGDRRMGGRNE